MLDILYDFSLDYLKWAFVIVVFLGPIFIILEGILSDIEKKKEAAKRYDIKVNYAYEIVEFFSVRYEFSRYTNEICIITDSGSQVWLEYHRVDITEVIK